MRPLRELRRYADTLRALSCLGRTQLAVLLLASATSAAMVASNTAFPLVMRLLSPTYFLLTCGGALFTIANENQFAFVALVLFLVQHAVFLTLTTVSGTGSPLRWVAVATNILGLLGYAALQVFARGTWGWHAFRSQLTSSELVQLYRRVQVLHTSLLLAFGNAVLALICICCMHRERIPWLRVALASIGALYSAVAGPLVAFCVHRDDKCGAITAGALSLVQFGCTLASAVLSTTEVSTGIDRLCNAQVFASALCHLFVAAALYSTEPIYGSEVIKAMASTRFGEHAALIDDVQVPVRRSGAPGRKLHGVRVVSDTAALNVPDADGGGWTSDDER